MAFEEMTYEYILKRMMDRVADNYPNIDTREGSILFNALAPAAIELAIMYTELDNTLNESFVNTASREFILLACEQMGMNTSVFEASAGVHKGEFNVEVPIGSRWSCELYNYDVTEYLGVENGYYTYRMLCDTKGTSPNNQSGELIPITDTPEGLTYAKLTECLIEGENETSDEDIRIAYYDFVNSTSTDGNVNQYKLWCNEYAGVGNSKIFPLWNGANTVKVSILSSSNHAASDELIDEFQNYLDPNSNGLGDGVAPIGSIVTVTTAEEVPITISATIKMKSGYTDTSSITSAINKYFSQIAYDKTTVPYMNLGAVILSAEGVDSLSNLLVNGGTVDIPLGEEQIPSLETTEWSVG